MIGTKKGLLVSFFAAMIWANACFAENAVVVINTINEAALTEELAEWKKLSFFDHVLILSPGIRNEADATRNHIARSLKDLAGFGLDSILYVLIGEASQRNNFYTSDFKEIDRELLQVNRKGLAQNIGLVFFNRGNISLDFSGVNDIRLWMADISFNQWNKLNDMRAKINSAGDAFNLNDMVNMVGGSLAPAGSDSLGSLVFQRGKATPVSDGCRIPDVEGRRRSEVKFSDCLTVDFKPVDTPDQDKDGIIFFMQRTSGATLKSGDVVPGGTEIIALVYRYYECRIPDLIGKVFDTDDFPDCLTVLDPNKIMTQDKYQEGRIAAIKTPTGNLLEPGMKVTEGTQIVPQVYRYEPPKCIIPYVNKKVYKGFEWPDCLQVMPKQEKSTDQAHWDGRIDSLNTADGQIIRAGTAVDAGFQVVPVVLVYDPPPCIVPAITGRRLSEVVWPDCITPMPPRTIDTDQKSLHNTIATLEKVNGTKLKPGDMIQPATQIIPVVFQYPESCIVPALTGRRQPEVAWPVCAIVLQARTVPTEQKNLHDTIAGLEKKDGSPLKTGDRIEPETEIVPLVYKWTPPDCRVPYVIGQPSDQVNLGDCFNILPESYKTTGEKEKNGRIAALLTEDGAPLRAGMEVPANTGLIVVVYRYEPPPPCVVPPFDGKTSDSVDWPDCFVRMDGKRVPTGDRKKDGQISGLRTEQGKLLNPGQVVEHGESIRVDTFAYEPPKCDVPDVIGKPLSAVKNTVGDCVRLKIRRQIASDPNRVGIISRLTTQSGADLNPGSQIVKGSPIVAHVWSEADLSDQVGRPLDDVKAYCRQNRLKYIASGELVCDDARVDRVTSITPLTGFADSPQPFEIKFGRKGMTVPSVIGQTLEEAFQSLGTFKIKTTGQGNKVRHVNPSVGDCVERDTEVTLNLDDEVCRPTKYPEVYSMSTNINQLTVYKGKDADLSDFDIEPRSIDPPDGYELNRVFSPNYKSRYMLTAFFPRKDASADFLLRILCKENMESIAPDITARELNPPVEVRDVAFASRISPKAVAAYLIDDHDQKWKTVKANDDIVAIGLGSNHNLGNYLAFATRSGQLYRKSLENNKQPPRLSLPDGPFSLDEIMNVQLIIRSERIFLFTHKRGAAWALDQDNRHQSLYNYRKSPNKSFLSVNTCLNPNVDPSKIKLGIVLLYRETAANNLSSRYYAQIMWLDSEGSKQTLPRLDLTDHISASRVDEARLFVRFTHSEFKEAVLILVYNDLDRGVVKRLNVSYSSGKKGFREIETTFNSEEYGKYSEYKEKQCGNVWKGIDLTKVLELMGNTKERVFYFGADNTYFNLGFVK